MKSVKEESIVIQLAVVATMMPKVKEYIDQQTDRIAELEKRKWSEQDIKNACIGARLSEEDFFRIKAYLPVYSSPQTKPLSDEEIFDLTAWKKNPYELYVEMEKEDMIAFARAIEERHGIK